MLLYVGNFKSIVVNNLCLADILNKYFIIYCLLAYKCKADNLNKNYFFLYDLS